MSRRLLEHDYIGLSENHSMEISGKSYRLNLNLKETELRLGLPGCESPERKSSTNLISLFGRDLQNANALNNVVAGSKRVFSDAIKDDGSDDAIVVGFEGKRNNTHKASQSAKPIQGKKPEVSATNDHENPPSAKAQFVGWPPIRSYRRNTMASILTKNMDDEDEEGKPEASGCLYVKVSMDGAPYLRKVDLRMYNNYMQLSSALEQMFTCFTIGECKSGVSDESSLRDLLHVSEYLLHMKTTMEIGCLLVMSLGTPRAMEKCRSHDNRRRIK